MTVWLVMRGDFHEGQEVDEIFKTHTSAEKHVYDIIDNTYDMWVNERIDYWVAPTRGAFINIIEREVK